MPDRQDAFLLFRIMELYLSDPIRRARRFLRTLPDGLSFDELTEQYPRDSEGFEHIDTIMVFWETVGSLIKHGFLDEELAFDTFLDSPPWPKLETALLSLRAASEGGEGVNLEFAYRRAREIKALAADDAEPAPVAEFEAERAGSPD